MKIVDKVAEKRREKEYYANIVSIFEKLSLFKNSWTNSYSFEIKLYEKQRFLFGLFSSLKAKIEVDYDDNSIEVKVSRLSPEQMESIKSALKEVEALRKKTKVTLTIMEYIFQ